VIPCDKLHQEIMRIILEFGLMTSLAISYLLSLFPWGGF